MVTKLFCVPIGPMIMIWLFVLVILRAVIERPSRSAQPLLSRNARA
jgi:hypothetical protein